MADLQRGGSSNIVAMALVTAVGGTAGLLGVYWSLQYFRSPSHQAPVKGVVASFVGIACVFASTFLGPRQGSFRGMRLFLRGASLFAMAGFAFLVLAVAVRK